MPKEVRPEETERYRTLMRESAAEEAYERDFQKRGEIPPTEFFREVVQVVPENARQREETSEPRMPTRRSRSAFEFLTGEDKAVYLALFGLLIGGSILALHGVAVGGTIYLLHVIHEFGFTQGALHAVTSNPGAMRIIEGVGIDGAAVIGLKVTSMLDKK